MSSEGSLHGGELAAAISRTVVGTLRRTTGRGPMKAKTTLGVLAVVRERTGVERVPPILSHEVPGRSGQLSN